MYVCVCIWLHVFACVLVCMSFHTSLPVCIPVYPLVLAHTSQIVCVMCVNVIIDRSRALGWPWCDRPGDKKSLGHMGQRVHGNGPCVLRGKAVPEALIDKPINL